MIPHETAQRMMSLLQANKAAAIAQSKNDKGRWFDRFAPWCLRSLRSAWAETETLNNIARAAMLSSTRAIEALSEALKIANESARSQEQIDVAQLVEKIVAGTFRSAVFQAIADTYVKAPDAGAEERRALVDAYLREVFPSIHQSVGGDTVGEVLNKLVN